MVAPLPIILTGKAQSDWAGGAVTLCQPLKMNQERAMCATKVFSSGSGKRALEVVQGQQFRQARNTRNRFYPKSRSGPGTKKDRKLDKRWLTPFFSVFDSFRTNCWRIVH